MSNLNRILNELGLPALPSHSPDTIAALLWAREVLQKHLTMSYAVQDKKGIDELKRVKIGGVDQWLHIRGRNRNNPVLLFLHGGPGGSVIGCMDSIQRPWEDYFTVVQWDQRSTGKSYYPADDENNPLSLDRFITDTEEVIQYLRRHFNQEKLFVLGHSWGSALGMYMVKRHPEWLHAYIGLGQLVNFVEGEKILYQRLQSYANKQNETEVIRKLEAISPLLEAESPAREKSIGENAQFVRRELSRLAGETLMRHLSYEDSLRTFGLNNLLSPHLSVEDLINATIAYKDPVARSPYTGFTKEYVDIDLPENIGSSFEVPIFFFSGRHDFQVPVTLSDQWFDEIEAPHKELIHFEESSHVIMNEEPGKFLLALVNQVLPFARSKINSPSKLTESVS